MKKRVFSITALFLAAALFGTAFSIFNPPASVKAETASEKAETVTVSGQSVVYETPDKAEVRFGVTSQDEEAAAAQQKNTEAVDKVLSSLKKLGIEEKSIRTTGYNMYQSYDYEKNQPNGYNVTTSLTVKDLAIDMAGKVLTEAVAAGANEMYGISYSCSTYDSAYEKALTDAVAAAKKKAGVLAAAAGKTLGDVQSVVEGYQDTSAQYSKTTAMAEADVMDAGASYSVMPGESEITATVSVTWYLK